MVATKAIQRTKAKTAHAARRCRKRSTSSKILEVPHLFQENDVECLPTCVCMVLKYYGLPASSDTLRAALNFTSTGSWYSENALQLLCRGLKTTLVMADPTLFPPDRTEGVTSPNQIFRYLNRAMTQNNFVHLRWVLEFIYNGGEVKIEIPSLAHIAESIDAGHPVIACTSAQALGSKEGGYHAVVVAGYDKRRVLLLNPLSGATAKGWFPIERFLLAVHSLPSPGGIFIRPAGLDGRMC